MKIGFPGLLTLIFITLKLCNVLAWSWWWVLSPIWITFMGAFVIILVATVIRALETPEQRIARRLRKFGDRLERAK